MTNAGIKPLSGKNTDALTDGIAANSGGVLLHCCCGPCATSVVERLLKFVRPTLYYYNPNTQPEEEYIKRLFELKRVAKHFSLELIAEDYDGGSFLNAVRGLELEREGGARCAVCFALRLRKTAQKASELGLSCFGTTLTVSPHKNAELINSIGYALENEMGVTFLAADFKKRNGYRRSVELSNELSLYRQNYCGCLFGRRSEK